MKTTKLIITFLTLFYAVSASAQFMNAPTAERTTTQPQVQQPRVKKVRNADTYTSRIYLSYDMTTLAYTSSSDYSTYDLDFNGFTAGYEYAISFVKAAPNLKLNIGAALSYARYAEEESGDYSYDVEGYEGSWTDKYAIDHVSISLPISLSYSLNLRNKVFFTPYTGFAFRYGLSMTGKYTEEASGEGWSFSGMEKEYYYSGSSVGNDFTHNRFNFAYQLGFNFDFNKFFIGLNYTCDLTKSYDYEEDFYYCEGKYDNLSIRLGLKF